MSQRHVNLSIIIVLTLFMLTGFMQTPVSAHVPEDMKLSYDFGTQILTVNVSHYTPNTKTHYIEQIEVEKNGISVLNKTYENQSLSGYVYELFSVSTVVDDNLTVTAFCSKDYTLTSWVIVTSTTATNPTSTETTTTTQPPDGPDSPDSTLGAGLAIAGGGIAIIILVVLYIEREHLPESVRQLGTRLRTGSLDVLYRLKTGFSNIIQQIRVRLGSK